MRDALKSEYAVIGSICIDPQLTDTVALNLVPDDFTNPYCRDIYAEALRNRGHFDAVTAANTLIPRLGEKKAGQFVVECMDMAPTQVNIEYHANTVHEAARFRTLRDAINTALGECPDGQTLADEVAGAAQRYLQEDNGTGTDMVQALIGLMNSLGKKEANVLYTGFHRLDEKLKGLRPGQLIVLGARPGVGKSAFLLNLALNVARAGKVVMFSMEMLADEIAQRSIVTRTSNLTLDKFLDEDFVQDDYSQAADSSGDISRLHPIIIDDRPALTIEQLRARVRLHPDVRLVVVDYLQLMKTPGDRKGRNWELGDLARDLKNFAVEAGVPIVVASQLNRGVDESDRPSLRSIRDSGEIESHASKVLLMWKAGDLIAIDVAKNRQGQTGVVQFYFDGSHMRFEESELKYVQPGRRRGRGFYDGDDDE